MPQAELGLAKAQPRVNRSVPSRVYGNSVIPGGVRGSLELTSALGRDKIVKAHYANFDAANAYVVHVESARLVYVSYRMGNAIYWTKNKVRLAKGEALLTDGKSFIRARCGNRIADMFQSRVSSMEPAPHVLDTALDLPQEALSLASNAPGSTGQGAVMSNALLNNGGNFAAPVDSVLPTPLQSLPPATASEIRRATARAPAGAELAPEAPDGVPALLPASARAIDDEVLAVLVTTLATQLTLSGPSLPFREILPVPVPLGTPTMQAPAIGMVTPTETVLAAFPSTLSDVPLPSKDLVADDATELPEPGSLVLLILALVLIALIRARTEFSFLRSA